MADVATTETVTPVTPAAPETTAAQRIYGTEGKPSEAPAPVAPAVPPAPATEKPAEPAKPAEAKTDSPPAKEIVPEKYNLKLPEGSQLPASAVEKVTLLAKELGLSQEKAQKLVENESALHQAYANENRLKFQEQVGTWAKDLASDKEVGGANFKENAEVAHRALMHFGGEGFAKALSDSGFGNHPDLFRAFYRIGKEMMDDKAVIPGNSTQGQGGDIASRLYGGTKQV